MADYSKEATLFGSGAAMGWNPLGWAMMGTAALSGGIKAIKGLSDKKKANELSDKYNLENAPKQELTQGMKDYVSLAEKQARGTMPGMENMKGDIRQSTAQTMTGIRQTASNESSAMAGLLGAMGQERQAMRQLGTQALQYQDTQQQRLGQAYQQLGQAQEGLFTTNEYMPWQMGMNQVDAYRNSGNQDIYGGLDQIGAAGIQGMNINYMNQGYGNMMPNYGGGQQTTQQASPQQSQWQMPGQSLQDRMMKQNPWSWTQPQTYNNPF